MLTLLISAHGHGQMTWPPSRHGGNLAEGGHCESRACMWFTQPTQIPGEPTINAQPLRTVNIDVVGGAEDWSRHAPWRAPGTAPVFGSGCGVMAGNALPIPNGGNAIASDPLPQGADGVLLPKRTPTVWKRGSIEEVAFSLNANHGGGYSWRLCRLDGNVSEACFQNTTLRFVGKRQWLQYDNSSYQYGDVVQLPRFELPPPVLVDEGTYPPGSQWARNPVPSCKLCDPYETCGPAVPLNLSDAFQPGFWMGNQTMYGGQPWFDAERCNQHCQGHNMSACPPYMTQFEEPLPGISGYSGRYVARQGLPFSVVDEVVVPDSLAPGDYLLSWRWDCEQTGQIWQNCADVHVA